MTKKKVIIITSIVITLSLLLAFCLNLCTKKDTNKNDSSVTTIKNSKTENNDDQLNVSDNNIQEHEEDVKKEEVEEKPKKEKPNNTSNKTSELKKENNVNNTKQESSVPVVQEQPKVQEQPAPTEPAKQSGPWEAWGMTEYEYYNEPYPKGARVDYPVSSCGSESACLNACASKGDTYVGYIYSCDIITSASGKFLGVMLDLEQVN